MQIHLLGERHPQLPAGDPGASSLLPLARSMVHDALLAAEVPVEADSDGGMSAQPVDAEQALHIIRQIQRLCQGFSKGLEGCLVYPAMGVMRAPATDGVPARMNRLVGRWAKPGLVLLPRELYQEMLPMPGETFAEVSGSDGDWWELLPPDWLERTITAPRVTAASSGEVMQARVRDASRALASARGSGEHGIRAVLGGMQGRRGLWAGATIAVVGLCVAAGVFHARDGARAPQASPAVGSRGVSEPRKESGASAVGVNGSVPRPVAAPLPSAVKADGSAPVITPPTNRQAQEATQPAGKADLERGRGSYSAEDIRILLEKADRLSGNGEYGRAIGYYNSVLRQDPRNVEAKRGLHRAEENRRQ